MAHSRIIDCSWDDDTKVATVTRSSKWGMFTSYAAPDQEDKKNANKWIGWEIADYKNRLAMAAERLKVMKGRAEGVNHIVSALGEMNAADGMDAFNVACREAKMINEQYRREQKRYQNMKNNFHIFCENEIKTREKLNKQVNQSE